MTGERGGGGERYPREYRTLRLDSVLCALVMAGLVVSLLSLLLLVFTTGYPTNKDIRYQSITPLDRAKALATIVPTAPCPIATELVRIVPVSVSSVARSPWGSWRSPTAPGLTTSSNAGQGHIQCEEYRLSLSKCPLVCHGFTACGISVASRCSGGRRRLGEVNVRLSLGPYSR
ncbi:hypothetical protein J6590_057416 [Homalodisca vitripennis]|nr:hypothetical protein J6590_057416 [Homalodisca vitripennis]